MADRGPGNFTTTRLTHSSSTPQRVSTSRDSAWLGNTQPASPQLPAESQAKVKKIAGTVLILLI